MGADRNANAQAQFEPQAAYLSTRSVELPLSPSASAAPPLGPRRFIAILPARERQCKRALTDTRTLRQSSSPKQPT